MYSCKLFGSYSRNLANARDFQFFLLLYLKRLHLLELIIQVPESTFQPFVFFSVWHGVPGDDEWA